jgi:hypothetical protein
MKRAAQVGVDDVTNYLYGTRRGDVLVGGDITDNVPFGGLVNVLIGDGGNDVLVAATSPAAESVCVSPAAISCTAVTATTR